MHDKALKQAVKKELGYGTENILPTLFNELSTQQNQSSFKIDNKIILKVPLTPKCFFR